MKIWKFKRIKEFFVFIYPKKNENNILTMSKDGIKVNSSQFGNNEMFQLIDVLEE